MIKFNEKTKQHFSLTLQWKQRKEHCIYTVEAHMVVHIKHVWVKLVLLAALLFMLLISSMFEEWVEKAITIKLGRWVNVPQIIYFSRRLLLFFSLVFVAFLLFVRVLFLSLRSTKRKKSRESSVQLSLIFICILKLFKT